MKMPGRFGIYLSARTSGWVLLEIALKGRRVVLWVPWKKPFGWGYGFIFHEDWFWLFRGMEVRCFKPKGAAV